MANTELVDSTEWTNAQTELKSFDEPEASTSTSYDSSKAPAATKFIVSVYGASECEENGEEWKIAEQLGVELGRANYHVLNGGYTGTMEAVSKGVRATKDATVEGVISPSTFINRKDGNEYLTHKTVTESIPQVCPGLIRV